MLQSRGSVVKVTLRNFHVVNVSLDKCFFVCVSQLLVADGRMHLVGRELISDDYLNGLYAFSNIRFECYLQRQ